MGSPHTIHMTAEILRSYSQAALRNADELLVEASLLRDHDHMARAYFLAVACIEEAGKALLCHDAQKRNLSDPAVCAKLKAHTQNHRQKIDYAMFSWALNDTDRRKALKVALDLMINLTHGREPSMYSDLRANPDRVQMPCEVVRAKASRDCVKLAASCLANAKRHMIEKTPFKTTSAQDRLFTLKPAKFQKMLNNVDFWWFYISCMEAGHQDIAEAVLKYEQDYITTGRLFQALQ